MGGLKVITIYTDGSANNRTRIGGFGITLRAGDYTKDYFEGSYHDTTSARMEIMAVLRALEMCSPDWELDIYSDNQYVVNTIAKGWLQGWIDDDILEHKANPDLWTKMYKQLERHNNRVKITHVKGHSGHPMNELADSLANEGRLLDRIIVDKRRP